MGLKDLKFQKIFQNKDENKKLDNIKAVLLDRYFD